MAQKQFLVHLWTLCQRVFRRAIAPVLGVKSSDLYSKMGATKDVASLWHRYGARPVPRLRNHLPIDAVAHKTIPLTHGRSNMPIVRRTDSP